MASRRAKVEELRKLSVDELNQRLKDSKEELFRLRFQHHTSQLENIRKLPEVKRNIARIHTILGQLAEK